jgi:hypothetical protein
MQEYCKSIQQSYHKPSHYSYVIRKERNKGDERLKDCQLSMEQLSRVIRGHVSELIVVSE